jgi:uncharacterized protein
MVRVRVRVQPGARRDEVGPWVDGVLRVKVSAPALAGRANRALVELIAAALGVTKSRVQVVRGATAREKVLEVEGLTDAEIGARLGDRQATGDA